MSAFPTNPFRADALKLSRDTFLALQNISILLPHEKRAIELALEAINNALKAEGTA